jgi:hypothetical protein
MPRFRFHLYNDVETMDPDGRVFPDFDAAHGDAIQNARALMAADLTGKGEINLAHWIELEDEQGEIVIVTFRDAVTIHDQPGGIAYG